MQTQHTTPTEALTPEELLQQLEARLALQRPKATAKSRNRATFLAVGILVIAVGAGIALTVLQQMLIELHEGGPAGESKSPATSEHRDF